MHSKDDYAAAVHFLPNGTEAERIALAMAFHRAYYNGFAAANEMVAGDLELLRERLAKAAKIHRRKVVPLVAA